MQADLRKKLVFPEEIETTTSCALRGHKLKETKNQDLARSWKRLGAQMIEQSLCGAMATEKLVRALR